MMLRMLAIFICSLIAPLVSGQGYGNRGYQQNNYEDNYEPPAPKLRFNIGFNVPSMSISLPKLDLPQISIRASIKQKKPFQLQLPRITFNSHVSAAEEEEEKPSYGKGYGQTPSYGSSNDVVRNYEEPQGGYNQPQNNYQPPQNNYNTGYQQPQQDTGYRTASSYQAPAQEYERPRPEEAYSYNAAPINNYQANQYLTSISQLTNGQSKQQATYQPQAPAVEQAYQPQQQGGYGQRVASAFQGQAVRDYKASSNVNTNYYVPAQPIVHNQHQKQQTNQYRPKH